MTHTHAIKRLLEHGELTWSELMEITGWSFNSLRSAIARLMEAGAVEKAPIAPRRNVYRLAA
jgi:transcription initiation factor IIE alpha subunit